MNDATEFEIGPVTRYMKAEAALEASEEQRRKDNEHLLERQGELQSEIDRLAPFQELAFEMGSQLKVLVTALCPIIRETMFEEGNTKWEEMVRVWEESRMRLGLTAEGKREEEAEV